METLLIFFVVLLNFGISWWNAHVTVKVWNETKTLGGFIRVVAWAGAIQSAFGFTFVFAIFLGGAAFAFHMIGAHAFAVLMDLTYLAIIPALLGSGIIITIYSWIGCCWLEHSRNGE